MFIVFRMPIAILLAWLCSTQIATCLRAQTSRDFVANLRQLEKIDPNRKTHLAKDVCLPLESLTLFSESDLSNFRTLASDVGLGLALTKRPSVEQVREGQKRLLRAREDLDESFGVLQDTLGDRFDEVYPPVSTLEERLDNVSVLITIFALATEDNPVLPTSLIEISGGFQLDYEDLEPYEREYVQDFLEYASEIKNPPSVAASLESRARLRRLADEANETLAKQRQSLTNLLRRLPRNYAGKRLIVLGALSAGVRDCSSVNRLRLEALKMLASRTAPNVAVEPVSPPEEEYPNEDEIVIEREPPGAGG